jgi:hypothetical protein
MWPNFMPRIFVVAFGISAIAWAIFVIPVYRTDAPLEAAAKGILSGDKFNVAQQNAMKLRLDAAPTGLLQGPALNNATVIRLFLLEDELKKGSPEQASDTAKLQMVVNAALAQSPMSSFMWLTDLWLKRQGGASADGDLNLLRMSYWSGPNESWIAARRAPLALSFFPLLPADLAEQVRSEFVGLVRSGLYVDAAGILAGVRSGIREQLLSRLVDVGAVDRRELAKALASKGVDGVTIPGADERPSRPF